MQKPLAVNDFIIRDCNHLTGVGANAVSKTILSMLTGGIGLPAATVQYAARYGRWPLVSGLNRPGSRLNLITHFCTSTPALRYAQRRSLLAELNPELEDLLRLLAADTIPPEGLLVAFGPWDVYADSASAWHSRSLRWTDVDTPLAEGDITGTVHFEDGNETRQRAIVIEEETTNLVANPSIETNITGWSSAWSDTVTRSDDQAKFGSHSLKIVSDGGPVGAIHTDIAGLTPAATVTVTAYVYVPSSNTTLITMQLTAWDGGGFTNAVVATTAVTDRWQRLEVQKTVPGGGSIRIGVSEGASAVGDLFYADGVQVEELDHSTTFCDGSLGPGYAWTGTAHASTSTREATEFNLDDHVDLVSAKDTLSFRAVVRAPYDATGDWPGADAYVFNIRLASPTDQIFVNFDSVNNRWEIRVGVGTFFSTAAQTFSAGDWIDLVYTLSYNGSGAGDYRFYVDGVLAASSTQANVDAATYTDWNLGTRHDATLHGNFWFAEYMVWDRVLSAGEIADMFANGPGAGRARYLNVECEVSGPLVIGGTPTDRGETSTLAISEEVRWHSRDGDVHFYGVYDDTWDANIEIDSDDDVYPIIKLTPGIAKDAGTGFQYRRFVRTEWKVDAQATNYPVVSTFATGPGGGTPIGDGKMQADGDDLRVYVNGTEVDRWLAGIDTASTNVWINLNFQPALNVDLKTAIAGAGAITEIEIQDDENIREFPASGILLINSEEFVYTSKNNTDRKFTGVTRSVRNTSIAAHAIDDDVTWIQHDVIIVYGDTTLSAPSVDDDFEPAFSLGASTNDVWDYDPAAGTGHFGADAGKRTGSWTRETVREYVPNNDPTFYTDNHFTDTDPWDEIGIEITFDAIGRWKLNNVCGITGGNFQSGEKFAANATGLSLAAVESSINGQAWVNEFDVPNIGVQNTWEAWSQDVTPLTTGSLWLSLRLNIVTNNNSNSWRNECADVAVTLDNTFTPDTTIAAEETNYSLNVTIDNETTGDAIKLNFPTMTLDQTLVIDTAAKTITYLEDGSSRLEILTLAGGVRRDWLRLIRGVNDINYNDTGTAEIDVEFLWHRRDWE